MSARSSAMTVGAILVAVAWTAPAWAQDTTLKPIPHDSAGREQCLMCHGGAMEGIPAVPESHAERQNEVCMWCHAQDAAMLTKTPPAIPHDLAGRDQCMMCHSGAMEGVPAPPADHEGRDVKFCSLCHQPTAG